MNAYFTEFSLVCTYSSFLLPVILGHVPVLILAVYKRMLARKKVKRNFQFFSLFVSVKI